MKDNEEIENTYKEKLESLDKEYIDNLNKGINKKQAEKTYLESIKKAREDYEKEYKDYLVLLVRN
jgi:hypothetical protein